MTKPVNPRGSKRTYASVTITTEADGLSEVVNLTGYFLAGVITSTAWTDSGIGFKVSVDGSTDMKDLRDTAGDLVTITTTADQATVVAATNFLGFDNLQLVSRTTSGAVIAQAAPREIQLALYAYVTSGS